MLEIVKLKPVRVKEMGHLSYRGGVEVFTGWGRGCVRGLRNDRLVLNVILISLRLAWKTVIEFPCVSLSVNGERNEKSTSSTCYMLSLTG